MLHIGQHQFAERNADYAEITRKAAFPMGRSLNSHDYVFWCGDFNYRIDNLSNEEVKSLIENDDWETLLENDQLRVQQKEGKVFRNYIEGEITFPPTYKYDINSDDYDTSEKCRCPAWTDRILYKKRYATHVGENLANNYGKILHYNRAELKTSDHRPVIAEMEIEVIRVDEEKRDQVFSQVLQQLGPIDATVYVTVKNEDNDYLSEEVVTAILKYLANEAGEIVLARYGEDHLRITFRDGQSAIKAASLETFSLLDQTVQIELKTPNWIEVIEEEIMINTTNTIPLVDTNFSPEEEEHDISLGPQCDPAYFCVGDEDDPITGRISPSPFGEDFAIDIPPPLPGRSTPTRAPPPARPPPPSKSLPPRPPPARNAQETANKEMPPAPPPRVDSFENEVFKFDNNNVEEEDPPLSPWHSLPPAPPLPPMDDVINDEPPPIPERPQTMIDISPAETGSRGRSNAPPLPARTRAPVVPPRRN